MLVLPFHVNVNRLRVKIGEGRGALGWRRGAVRSVGNKKAVTGLDRGNRGPQWGMTSPQRTLKSDKSRIGN